MSFSDVYANEVLESRRTRSDRARFWAKIVSFLLMITVAVTLRSDPQLRVALISAAMNGVSNVMGTAQGPVVRIPNVQATQAQPDTHAGPPKTGVRVNRPGIDQMPGGRLAQDPGTPGIDTQMTADEIGRLLQSLSRKN